MAQNPFLVFFPGHPIVSFLPDSLHDRNRKASSGKYLEDVANLFKKSSAGNYESGINTDETNLKTDREDWGGAGANGTGGPAAPTKPTKCFKSFQNRRTAY